MLITHNLRLNLTKCGCQPVVDVVQGDANTRQLNITLFSNNTIWEAPAGTTAALAFLKPDGTQGLYDKLPNGEPATVVNGYTITAILAPQVLTCAGTVLASIVFYDKDMDTLATFPFRIVVEKNPAADQSISNNYYALQNLDQVNRAYDDLVAQIGDLSQLQTKAKDNLVNAINEVMSKAGAGGGSGVYTLAEGETLADVPPEYDVVIDPYADEDVPLASGVYTLSEGETIEDVPPEYDVVIDPYAEPDIPEADISLNVEGASVGQIVKIAAVDEAGKPTAWEAVDFPKKGVDYFDGEDGKDGSPGKDGADGYTPVKGVDYYTDADKTEMVNAVIAALPTWTGGSY